MDDLAVIARLALIATFAVSGTAKLLDPGGTRTAVEQFRVPARLVGATTRALPLVELAIVGLLLNVSSAPAGGVAAFVLLAGFVVAVIRALAEEERPDCHCFGQLHSRPVGASTLIRNAALMAMAGVVVLAGGGEPIGAWQRDEPAAQAAVIATAVAVAAALGMLVWRRGRPADQARQGLPPGTLAPAFTLPSASGDEVRLDDLLARDRRLVLVFITLGCGPCKALRPQIAEWQRLERLSIAVLVGGSAESVSASDVPDQLRDVLVDEDAATRDAYGVRGTPGAVIVAPDGTILSEAATGTVAIEQLILEALGLRDLVDDIAPMPSVEGDAPEPQSEATATPLDIDADFRPVGRADVVLAQRDGEDVLVDQQTAGVHLLNPTAAVVWQILDASASIEDLAVDVSEEFGAPLEEVRSQIVGVVRHFGQLGLLEAVTPLQPEQHEHAH